MDTKMNEKQHKRRQFEEKTLNDQPMKPPSCCYSLSLRLRELERLWLDQSGDINGFETRIATNHVRQRGQKGLHPDLHLSGSHLDDIVVHRLPHHVPQWMVARGDPYLTVGHRRPHRIFDGEFERTVDSRRSMLHQLGGEAIGHCLTAQSIHEDDLMYNRFNLMNNQNVFILMNNQNEFKMST